MKTSRLYSVLVVGGAALVAGCGGDDTPGFGPSALSGQGGTPAESGGTPTSNGGRPVAAGGESANGGTTGGGGSAETGGVAPAGGSAGEAGHPATGGVSGGGGKPATGGAPSNGGGTADCCPAACWDWGGTPCACTGGVCCWLSPTNPKCAHKCP
jgi:hypothetical protein